MTVWRWGASNVPGLSAFMPAISKFSGSYQQYKGDVDGQPGTQAIPAPNNDIPQDKYAAGVKSSMAPPYWFPQVWYQVRLPGLPFPGGGNDAGVRVHSDNQLPVPAVEPFRGTRRFGGGQVYPVYQDPYRRAVTKRTVQARNA